jgi:hypothetical protein
MAGIAIEFSEAQYQRAVAVLDPAQLRKAQFQAIKRATNKGTTIARKEVQKVLTINAKYVKRAVTTQLEIRDPEPPVGIVRISRRRLPAIAYNPSVSKRGVRFRTWKDRPARVFPHAFKATVNKQNAKVEDEFHTGIFIRTRHVSANPKAGKLTPKGFAGRLAIKQLMAPSVESAVELPKVGQAVYDGLAGEMDKQLNSQIDRFTK